ETRAAHRDETRGTDGEQIDGPGADAHQVYGDRRLRRRAVRGRGAAHRGIRRQIGCGTSRATANITRSCHGIHTMPARQATTRSTTTSATCSGVDENGAGSIPAVIRPITKPGRGMMSVTPVPCRASAIPEAKPSRPALAEP